MRVAVQLPGDVMGCVERVFGDVCAPSHGKQRRRRRLPGAHARRDERRERRGCTLSRSEGGATL